MRLDAGRVLSEAEHSVLFPSLPAQQEHACFQGSSGGVWREESAVTGGGRISGVARGMKSGGPWHLNLTSSLRLLGDL